MSDSRRLNLFTMIETKCLSSEPWVVEEEQTLGHMRD